MALMKTLPCAAAAILFLACAPGYGREPKAAEPSIASVGGLLAGRFENSAQVAQGAGAAAPPPQHVTITVEPTPQPAWQLWHIHMDVDAKTAQSAGSDTSLDAVWAMNIVRQTHDKALSLVPYTLRSISSGTAPPGAAFDESQWLALEACMLRGQFTTARILVQQSVDEMCAAAGMGLGGKRAFLPISVDADGERLAVQLIFFGEPWRVDARRVQSGVVTDR